MRQRQLIDDDVAHWVIHVRDRACLYGAFGGDPCRGPQAYHAHHIQKRSQGGNDVPENLITLCVHHHELAEKRLIEAIKFMKILHDLYGYEYEELQHG